MGSRARIPVACAIGMMLLLALFSGMATPSERPDGRPLVGPPGCEPNSTMPNSSEPLAMGTVCVLVEDGLYPSIKTPLLTYVSDLTGEGYSVDVVNSSWTLPSEVRAFLHDEWVGTGYDLVGAVIVGDLPYANFEMFDDFDEGAYARFPIDHYYTDLDGNWADTTSNGILDSHTSGSGDLQPEIWLGRVSISSAWEDEAVLICHYFNKTHEYRVGDLSLPHKALHYVDDDWVPWTEEYGDPITAVYPDLTTVNDVYMTNATDYSQRVQHGYEWIQVHCHANHSPCQHAFIYGDGVKGSGGNFRSENLSQDGQRCLFANVFTCGAANYTNDDYLCGWYIFTDTYGLCNVGSSKSGSMLEFYDFYDPLAAGECIGDAFKEWFSIWAEGELWGSGYNNYARSWFYGMTVIGDPTLSPLLEDTKPPANVTGLTIALDGADVVLNWTAPITHDVGHYLVYRANALDGFDFGTPYHDTSADADPLAATWADMGAGMDDTQNYFYVVRAVDYGNNVEENVNVVGKHSGVVTDGWNLVSTPFVQSNTSLSEVLQSVTWDHVQTYDVICGLWLSNLVGRPEIYNDLLVIDHLTGVWVHCTGQGHLVTVGRVQSQTDITLQAGWNLVGYPSPTTRTAADALPPEVDMTSICDLAQPYHIRDVTDFNSFDLEPGHAYWLHCTSEVTWTVYA
jgi:hypothetical protein